MKRVLVVAVLLLALLALGVRFVLHPYLAVNRPVGAVDMVVEGWLPEDRVAEVAQLFRTGGYTRLYVTGTVRPAAYYLRTHEALDVVLRRPFQGLVRVNASGTSGAVLRILADRDTLLEEVLTVDPTEHRVQVSTPAHEVRFESLNPSGYAGDGENLFLRHIHLGDSSVHRLYREIFLVDATGRSTYATPTYAHACARALVAAGVPEERIVVVPAFAGPEGRSKANADAFGLKAAQDGVEAVDLVTLGVHARRSWARMRQACPSGTRVGVVALDDPECPGDGWWRTALGRSKVWKEVLGISHLQVTP